jgi:hypothetical protein
MRANTPSRIHPRRLLLRPRLSPVPSVDIRSSTSASAGDAAVTALAAASSDAPWAVAGADGSMPFFEAPQRTFSALALSRGSPAIVQQPPLVITAGSRSR